MNALPKIHVILVTAVLAVALMNVVSISAAAPTAKLAVEPGHPMTPPFGLARVGRPWEAVVEVPRALASNHEYVVAGYREGREVSHRLIALNEGDRRLANAKPGTGSLFGRVVLDDWPDRVALWVRSGKAGEWSEAARVPVRLPDFEGEVEARAEQVINPVDLGAILPPANGLLLAGGQQARVKLAALTRNHDLTGGRICAWYDSLPDLKVIRDFSLVRDQRAEAELELGPCSPALLRDMLHVVVLDGAGGEVWRKDIRTMLVPKPPQWPRFGAVSTRLRHDEPILRPDAKTTPYNETWDPKLEDLVVFFPNGARWVFWRGWNYCPFWAGRGNAGLSYQWAERSPASDGIGWCEPLFDRELRYGRVEIVASSPSRVHVRWKYQTSDVRYHGTGDSISEDYYFYPDGFGTRTLTVVRDPSWRYQFEELIVVRPANSELLDILPAAPLEALSLKNEKVVVTLPVKGSRPANIMDELGRWPGNGDTPAMYRVRFDRREAMTPIGFSLTNNGRPRVVPPIYDRGVKVPPYDSIAAWPGTLDWFGEQFAQQPFRSQTVKAKNAAGEPTRRSVDTYVWLIGMTDEADDRLLQRAAGFARPPVLEASGARIEPYVPERRAFRLEVEQATVRIRIKAGVACVNPVFEIEHAPKVLKDVVVDGVRLERAHYAWDGRTLWLDLTLSHPAELRLHFAEPNGQG